MSNRNLENPIQRIVPAFKALVSIFTNLLSRNIIIKQEYYIVDKAKKRGGNSKIRAMIISKIPLNLSKVENYDDFLLGSSLRVH